LTSAETRLNTASFSKNSDKEGEAAVTVCFTEINKAGFKFPH